MPMPGNPPAEPHPSQPTFLSGGGGMGERMRALDWSATPLGPVAGWPEALRSATSIMLNSRFPIALYWGEELALLYNDAWSPIPGGKHPWALGQPGRQRPRPGPAGLDRRRRPVAARLARARRPAGATASTPGFRLASDRAWPGA